MHSALAGWTRIRKEHVVVPHTLPGVQHDGRGAPLPNLAQRHLSVHHSVIVTTINQCMKPDWHCGAVRSLLGHTRVCGAGVHTMCNVT